MRRSDQCGDMVRQGREREAAPDSHRTPISLVAHPSDRLLIPLEAGWCVVEDDLQYILQRRKGKARQKATGWRGRSFCRTREAVLRCIREYCSHIDEDKLQQVRALPEWHVDRSGRNSKSETPGNEMVGNETPEPRNPGAEGLETVARPGNGLPRGAAKPRRSPKGRCAAAGARSAS